MGSWLFIVMVVFILVSFLVYFFILVVVGCVFCVKLGDCMSVVWVNGLLIVLGLLISLYVSLMVFFEFDFKKILVYLIML